MEVKHILPDSSSTAVQITEKSVPSLEYRDYRCCSARSTRFQMF